MLSRLHQRIWVLDIFEEIKGSKEQGWEVIGVVLGASPIRDGDSCRLVGRHFRDFSALEAADGVCDGAAAMLDVPRLLEV